MSTTLSIRNLTGLSLTLIAVDRKHSRLRVKKKKTILADLDCIKPGLCGDHEDDDDREDEQTRPDLANINKEISWSKEDVTVEIKPFSIVHTTIGVHETSLCLTFSYAHDAAYQTNFLLRPGRTEVLTEGFGPKPGLFGLRLDYRFLAIFIELDLARWMATYSDSTPIQMLSIPGTHNSPTYYRALPSVRCQAVSLREQLEHGIRFLDFRLQVDHPGNKNSDSLIVVHSVFPIALSGPKQFRPFYNEILAFLKQNPSETIFLSLKREGTGKGTDADLAQTLHDHYIDAEHWVASPGLPTLGAARGKIILFRRFGLRSESTRFGSKIIGVHAHGWKDNSPNTRIGEVLVQDFYEVQHTRNIDKKIAYAREHCDRISRLAPESSSCAPLAVNFFSASNFWRAGCWPEKIAARINPAMTQYLCAEHGTKAGRRHGCTGIVVCDWVGEDGNWDLVRAIVGMNESLELQGCEGERVPTNVGSHQRT